MTEIRINSVLSDKRIDRLKEAVAAYDGVYSGGDNTHTFTFPWEDAAQEQVIEGKLIAILGDETIDTPTAQQDQVSFYLVGGGAIAALAMLIGVPTAYYHFGYDGEAQGVGSLAPAQAQAVPHGTTWERPVAPATPTMSTPHVTTSTVRVKDDVVATSKPTTSTPLKLSGTSPSVPTTTYAVKKGASGNVRTMRAGTQVTGNVSKGTVVGHNSRPSTTGYKGTGTGRKMAQGAHAQPNGGNHVSASKTSNAQPTPLPGCTEQKNKGLKLTPWCADHFAKQQAPKVATPPTQVAKTTPVTAKVVASKPVETPSKESTPVNAGAVGKHVKVAIPANQPTQLPACKEQVKQGKGLTPWCKVHLTKTNITSYKARKSKPVADLNTKVDPIVKTVLREHQKATVVCGDMTRRHVKSNKCASRPTKRKVYKEVPKVDKPVKLKPNKQKRLIKKERHVKGKKVVRNPAMVKPTHKPKRKLRHGRPQPHEIPGDFDMPNLFKKMPKGLTLAEKKRLRAAGVNVYNGDYGWTIPVGAEVVWTGRSDCLNQDGSYKIPAVNCK